MSADPITGLHGVDMALREINDSFTVWYRAKWGSLYMYARYLGADPELAEDIVQESAIKLWLAWPFRSEDILSNDGYARATVRNTLFSHWRQKRVQTVSGLEIEPLISVYEESFNPRVWKALSLLEPRYREVLFLIHVESYEVHEAAVVMQIGTRTAYNYHSLAKKAFRHEYEALAG